MKERLVFTQEVALYATWSRCMGLTFGHRGLMHSYNATFKLDDGVLTVYESGLEKVTLDMEEYMRKGLKMPELEIRVQ